MLEFWTESAPEDPVLGYLIDVSNSFVCSMVGVRQPVQPHPQHWRSRWDYVAFLVTEGEIFLTDEIADGPEAVRVGPGEIHCIAPGFHQASTIPFAPGSRFLWFHFGVNCVPTPVRSSQIPALVRREVDDARTVDQWLIPRHLTLGPRLARVCDLHRELVDTQHTWGGRDRAGDAICQLMVHELRCEFRRQIQVELLRTGDRVQANHVQRAMAFVRCHFDEPITPRDVAEKVGVSPGYLSRIFSALRDETLGDYILRTRIRSAKAMLETGFYTVKEVAFLCGFSSASYFCRMFRRLEGMTPGEFSAQS